MIESLLPYCPDPVLRYGIRSFSRRRLDECRRGGIETQWQNQSQWLQELKLSPIAIDTQAANDQHYEVPAPFFEWTLGKNLKYSSALWKEGTKDLDQAEDDMLDLSIQRADLKNGHRILELGCGWGSLTLEMAKRFPESKITGVSNSNSQRAFIEKQAAERGLSNVEIITCDMNLFDTAHDQFDRAVSVEMFEHMRNWPSLLEKISGWLKPDGQLFVHIFTHREHGYAYEVVDDTDWMSKYFFTGGQMPSAQQFAYFQDHLKVEHQWAVSGVHYQKTAEAWLQKTDENRERILELFSKVHGSDAKLWFQRWRIFYMSCAEFFGLKGGDEWFVSHYRFRNRKESMVQALRESA